MKPSKDPSGGTAASIAGSPLPAPRTIASESAEFSPQGSLPGAPDRRSQVFLAHLLRPHRDWGSLLIVGFGLYTLAFLFWQALSSGSPHKVLISDLVFLPTSLTGALLAWRSARFALLSPQTRRAWRFIAVSFLAYWLGDALWAWHELVRHQSPFPSLADGGHLLFYPFMFAGVLSIPTRPRTAGERLRFWFDVATTALAATVVVWYILLGAGGTLPALGALSVAIAVAYPIADVILLFAIIRLWFSTTASPDAGGLRLLAAALALLVAADLGFARLTFNASYEGGDWPDSLWMLAQFLVALSAHYQRWIAASGTMADSAPRNQRFESVLLYVALVASSSLVGFAIFPVVPFPLNGLLIGVALLASIVLIRQVTLLSDNGRLLRQSILAAHELRQSEARFRQLQEHAPAGIFVLDRDANIRYASPSSARLLGWRPENGADENFLHLVWADDTPRVRTLLADLVRSATGARTLETRLRHADGTWRWVEMHLTNLLANVHVEGLVVNYRDVTERHSLDEELARQALHDGLTGLANRRLLYQRLTDAIERANQSGALLAVLFLDLDDFKQVNDTLGHSSGDQLLVEVAERLKHSVRPTDMVARVGGDEFAVLTEAVTKEDDAMHVAERIIAALRPPITLGSASAKVQGSVGIALHQSSERSADELLTNADVAMYAAKAAGKARYAVYTSEMRRQVLKHSA